VEWRTGAAGPELNPAPPRLTTTGGSLSPARFNRSSVMTKFSVTSTVANQVEAFCPSNSAIPAVSISGSRTLAAALPKCKLEWDSGIVEPKP
jgi:hypothetical protein